MNWYDTYDELRLRAVLGAGTSILQKTGVLDKTIDAEYEAQEKRLKELGGNVERLHKEAKAYLDSLRVVALGQEHLATELASSLERNGSKSMGNGSRKAKQYRELLASLGAADRHDFDEAYRATVLDPIVRFGIIFPECEELCKKRADKLLDYDSTRSKTRKALDKPSKDSEKLPRLETEESEARRMYEEYNTLLIEGISQLAAISDPYLTPSRQALIQLNLKWACDGEIHLQSISPTLQSINWGNIEDTLSELKQLKVLAP